MRSNNDFKAKNDALVLKVKAEGQEKNVGSKGRVGDFKR
jgi:hypothetical protein